MYRERRNWQVRDAIRIADGLMTRKQFMYEGVLFTVPSRNTQDEAERNRAESVRYEIHGFINEWYHLPTLSQMNKKHKADVWSHEIVRNSQDGKDREVLEVYSFYEHLKEPQHRGKFEFCILNAMMQQQFLDKFNHAKISSNDKNAVILIPTRAYAVDMTNNLLGGNGAGLAFYRYQMDRCKRLIHNPPPNGPTTEALSKLKDEAELWFNWII